MKVIAASVLKVICRSSTQRYLLRQDTAGLNAPWYPYLKSEGLISSQHYSVFKSRICHGRTEETQELDFVNVNKKINVFGGLSMPVKAILPQNGCFSYRYADKHHSVNFLETKFVHSLWSLGLGLWMSRRHLRGLFTEYGSAYGLSVQAKLGSCFE
ncbi:MAG: hypothetical protein HWE23_10490 [Rhodobacteraceae bacterium]|nr:hypothetical protein [Paracoccaceae bacterium]